MHELAATTARTRTPQVPAEGFNRGVMVRISVKSKYLVLKNLVATTARTRAPQVPAEGFNRGVKTRR